MVCCLPMCAKGSFVPCTMEGGFWPLVFLGAPGGSFDWEMLALLEPGMRGYTWRWTRPLGGGRCGYLATFREFTEFLANGLVLRTVLVAALAILNCFICGGNNAILVSPYVVFLVSHKSQFRFG